MRRSARRGATLISAFLVVAGLGSAAARAEIVFETRRDAGVGASPTAFAFLPGGPPMLLVAATDGITTWRHAPEGLIAGSRSTLGRGAQLLAIGAVAPGGELAVAIASREAARVTLASVDRQGVLGATEQLELPGLPRAVRIGSLEPGAGAALLVAHDTGISVFQRGPAGWRRSEVMVPPFTADFVLGDISGDGMADLVLADEPTSQLIVLPGAGRGTFREPVRVSTVRGARRVALLDPGSGKPPRLLVIGADTLAVHAIGAGGAVKPAQALYRADHLADVAVGDVDGDGNTDLAVLDRSRSSVSILLGRPDGTFAGGESYLIGYGADAVLLADIDGDRRLDALTLNRLGESATVLRGRGGGVFDGVVSLPADFGDLTALAIDDFNGDDEPDLAVASEDAGMVGIYLGRGNGRFAAVSAVRVGRQPRALVAGDFNQDGFADLAVVNFGGDAVAILQGDGRGGFAAPRLIAVGTGPSAISTGSFGGDTTTDLAIVNSLSDSVSVLYSDGRGAFPEVATFPVAARPSFLMVGDTNRDGHQDLVVGSQFSESVAVFLGDGRRLGAPTSSKLAGTAKPSQAEDFDRDGQMDLVNPDESAGVVEILPGTAPGSFGTPLRLEVGRDPRAVALGDFDHDGRTDLAIAHRTGRTIVILLNRSPAPRPRPHGARAAGASPDETS